MGQPYIVTEDILAGSWTRFWNLVVDYIVRIIIGGIIGGIAGVLAAVLEDYRYSDWAVDMNYFEQWLLGSVVSVVYYTAMEATLGQSIGKLITGTIVVDDNGFRPDTATVLKRSLCRLIPFDAFSYLGGNRGWHDSIPDVYVVKKRALLEAKRLHDDFEMMGSDAANGTDPE